MFAELLSDTVMAPARIISVCMCRMDISDLKSPYLDGHSTWSWVALVKAIRYFMKSSLFVVYVQWSIFLQDQIKNIFDVLIGVIFRRDTR